LKLKLKKKKAFLVSSINSSIIYQADPGLTTGGPWIKFSSKKCILHLFLNVVNVEC